MNATTITTGKGTLSYVHVFAPVTAPGSDVAKYSLSFIIPKSDKATITKFNAALEEAKKVGATTKWGGKLPAKLHLPLRDGDEEKPDDPAYANSLFFNCSSKNKPGVVDANIQDILNPAEVYSGCIGRVNINLYPYDSNGNRGIAVGLNSVQKIADGKPLGGAAPSTQEAFGSEDGLLD